jgi:hypothetical protein
MGTVRMLARSELRRRWRSTVMLAVLVGTIGALIIATAAGARRSETALDRFNRFSRTSALEISVGTPTPAQLRTFRASPGVAAFALLHGYSLGVAAFPNLAIATPVDSAMGNVVDRSRVIEGRRVNPDAPDEASIGEGLAKSLHLGVGDHLDTTSYTQQQIVEGFSGKPVGGPAGPRVRLRVVEIDRRPLDLGLRAASGGVVILSPAFNAKYGNDVGRYTDVLRVRTRSPSDLRGVVALARRLWGHEQTFGVQPLGIEAEGARNAIDVLTLALWIFAGVAALAGAVTIGIVLTRDIATSALDQDTLRSLGVTRGQAIAASGARALIIAGTGTLTAGLVAIALSPRFPIGIARRADPNVGLHADWTAVGVGIALVGAVVLTIAFLAAWRSTSAPSPARLARARRRTSTPVELAARAGLRPTVTGGLRMALQPGRGASSVPVRSGFAGMVFGVAGVTAVLVFAGSLSHLVATPRLAGWTWDLKAEVPTPEGRQAVCTNESQFGLDGVRGVAAVAAVCIQSVQVEGRPVSVWGIDTLRGSTELEIVSGRAPSQPDEVALGAVTLRDAHKHIGDTVSVHGDRATRTFRVVGQVVLPSITEPQPLADGAAFTKAGMSPLLVKGHDETHYLLVRYARGADVGAIKRALRTDKRVRIITGPIQLPTEIARLQQINWFPAILATLLATLALIAVGHTLVTGVRRRRRELALLKTIGFDHRQVGATVAWQASTIAMVGVALGIPIGLIVGRVVWRAVADSLGVAQLTTTPAWAVALTAAAALLLANVVAFVPGRAAGRTRPAVALRAE